MRKRTGLRRWIRYGLWLVLLVFIGVGVIMIDTWSALGKRPGGERLVRIQNSPQYAGSKFANPLPPQNPDFFHVLRRWFFEETPDKEPAIPIPVNQIEPAFFEDFPADLRITWFGHSSFLVEVDQQRILVDPVWGEYASPGRVFGVKRFFAPPISLDDLPSIDAVVLSHDHYDHLNEPTIKLLKDKVPLFVAPLGLGAHLEYWGVPPEKIRELDWWGEVAIGDVRLVCTPARHFSGRAMVDRDATLWSGWAFIGQDRRAFYSGDTGMFPGFEEIGERLGPFDITLMETGAYNVDWVDVHMGPEQAVAAHRMVRGNLLVPVHWGTFALAFHSWTEPVERVIAAAQSVGIEVSTPRPGESIVPSGSVPQDRWWPSVSWKTARESPIISTSLTDEILERIREVEN